MNIEIYTTTKSKQAKTVGDSMAKWMRTYVRTFNEFSSNRTIDLLVIGFDDSLLKDKELIEFIESLSRQNVKNVALFSSFMFNDKKMKKIVHLCQQQQLPLLREQYMWKAVKEDDLFSNQDVIDGARLYIEDMANIVRNYY